MKYIFAYVAVIVLTLPCFRFGGVLAGLLTGFPVGLLLLRAPEQLRGIVAGLITGIGSVAASFALGYFVFRLILGSSAFGLIPILAATIPLVIPIGMDITRSRLLSQDAERMRQLLDGQPTSVQGSVSQNIAPVATATSFRFRAAGAIFGLVLVFAWYFFIRHGTA